jgi:hypothetical protein
MSERVAPMLTQRCSATNRLGKRCGKASVEGGLCLVHAGKQNMAAIGSAGGRASAASRNGLTEHVADEKLRNLGKRRLEALVNSDNEQIALRAATALYSYRAQQPPRNALESSYDPSDPPHLINGKPVSIAAVLEVAVFDAQGLLDDELATVILRSATRVRKLEAEGKLSPTFVDEEPEQGVAKFT